MLVKNNYFKSIVTLVTGSSVAQLIPIMISPILTRLYSPEQFGELALFLGVCSILSIVVTGRYELAIVLPKSDSTARHTFILALGLAMLVCSLLSCIIFLRYEDVAYLFEDKWLSEWLYLIPLYTLLLAAYQCFNYWNTRKGNFNIIASNRVMQTGTTGSSNLYFGSTGYTNFGLILGSVFGVLVALLRLAAKSNIGLKCSLPKLILVAKKYSHFPKYGMLSSLFNTCSSQAPVLLLSFLFNSSVAGFYSLANRILVLPMSIIGGSVGQAYLNQITTNKDDNDFVKNITYSTVKKLYYIGFLPMLILMGFGDYLFAFVFGEKWIVAGVYAQLLTPWMFLVFITSPVSNLLICFEKQKESLIYNSTLFSFRIGALFLGWYAFNDAYSAVMLFTIVGILFWFGFLWYLLKMVTINVFDIFKHFSLFLICTFILQFVRYGVS